MGKLSIVATPIGNLEDITLRAIRVLSEAQLVLAEDTRVTKKLLSRYEIKTPVARYDAHASASRHEGILEKLREGMHIALVTDAGTPGISDPGFLIVDMVRRELPDAIIEAIPGASALTAALSIVGVPASEFLFLGFLPHKKGRETLFKKIAASEIPVVFYESPHRIEKALTSLDTLLPETRMVAVARELTKIHEEVVRGSASEVLNHFKMHPDRVRGEYVVVVDKG